MDGTGPLALTQPTDDCVCQATMDDSNAQTTFMQYGALTQDSIWDASVGTHNGRNPLAYLANGEESTNAKWGKKTVRFHDDNTYLVGCSASLNAYASALDIILGLKGSHAQLDVTAPASTTQFTKTMDHCISSANVADSMVHTYYGEACHGDTTEPSSGVCDDGEGKNDLGCRTPP